jgi:DNA integrity scanning protein DisA with diadenylate cyclase activity
MIWRVKRLVVEAKLIKNIGICWLSTFQLFGTFISHLKLLISFVAYHINYKLFKWDQIERISKESSSVVVSESLREVLNFAGSVSHVKLILFKLQHVINSLVLYKLLMLMEFVTFVSLVSVSMSARCHHILSYEMSLLCWCWVIMKNKVKRQHNSIILSQLNLAPLPWRALFL